MRSIVRKLAGFISKYYLIVVANLSLYSIAGSLYFSEIVGLEPCLYCWYQRIFMYPLLPIAIVGYLYKDKNAYRYILPLAIPGMLLAGFQYYLQMTQSTAAVFSCSANSTGPSCSSIDFQALGFITIPFLSLLAFVGIVAVCIVKIYWERRKAKTVVPAK